MIGTMLYISICTLTAARHPDSCRGVLHVYSAELKDRGLQAGIPPPQMPQKALVASGKITIGNVQNGRAVLKS